MALSKILQQARAKGNNFLRSQNIFIEKKFYYNEVYPDGTSPWAIRPIDFVNDNPLYGRVDMKKDFVYPKKDRLRSLNVKSKKADVRVLSFVADAFEDLKRYITAHIANGYLNRTGIIAQLEPTRAFYDIKKMYEKYINVHYAHFTLIYLALATDSSIHRNFPPEKKIINFLDFMKHFNEFIKTSGKVLPFTLSGLAASGNLSPLYTGLCIEIHDAKYDDDEEKHKFVDDPNFSFFQLAARKHGFLLDRNVPWRLVADVTSYKMREYIRIDYERPLVKEALETIHADLDKDLQSIFPTAEDLKPTGNWEYGDNWTKIEADADALKVFQDFEVAKAGIISDLSNTNKIILQTFKGAEDPQYTVTYDNTLSYPFSVIKTEECDDANNCTSWVFKMDAIFDEYYNKVYIDEPLVMKEIMWRFWNSFILKNQSVKVSKVIGCSDSGFKTRIVEHVNRQAIAWVDYVAEYGDLFWLKTYFDIRIAENRIRWNKNKYNRKIKKAFSMSKILDFESSIAYINSETKKRLLGYGEIYKEKETQVDDALAKILPLGATLPAGQSY